jgi:DNA modification methylase
MLLTNEEKRTVVYAKAERPTVPGEVTPDTPLEELNLNWREKDLPERVRTKHVHRLHPYLGKFIPQLVEVFLRKYFRPGQTLLDPFCGSGTTLVQANELGVNAIGYDVSAFNVLLSRAKTTRYNLTEARQMILEILEQTRLATQSKSYQLTLWETNSNLPKLADMTDPYLEAWFAPQARRELLTYRHFIEAGNEAGSYKYQDLLKVILSRSARSARLTTHFDLDFPKQPQTEPYWCYKHSRTCYPTQEAFQFINRYSLDTIHRLEEFAGRRTNATVAVHHADSSRADFPPIDGVITSPPYVGLIDYHQQHNYAYHLLKLEDRREEEIGPASRGASQRACKQYQADIAAVFRRAAEAMPIGGRMIVVAADRADLYGGIAEMVGVEVEQIIQRHVNRRTGRRASEFYESVFIWRKI